MGCVYRPKGRKQWMVKWRDLNGVIHRVSSRSKLKTDAQRLLRDREHKTDQGVLITPEVGKITFGDGVQLLVDYHTARDRSTKKLEGRIAKHLTPHFGQRRLMASITGADLMDYVAKRKKDVTVLKDGRQKAVKNATVNRELTWVKQMFTLAIRAGKLLNRPHFELLPENNARQGFFEPEQYQSVLKHLPEELRPVATFAYITGWRMKDEVLGLEWRQVDMKAGEVRLEPGTTKNKEGRTFPFTAGLRTLLEAQLKEHERWKKKGHIVPQVFFREVAIGRRGPLRPRKITSMSKAFKSACVRAGCPGRIPHDFRRTAVRNLERAGVPRSVAMKMVGHKTESVYRRYAIVSGNDLKEAAAKLDAAAV